MKEAKSQISLQTLKRLPNYLNYLKKLEAEGKETISSPQIATYLELNEVQVRKDLAVASSGGKSKVGYKISKLIVEIETFLGYNNVTNAVIVGAGQLGRALMGYKGFKEVGINILTAFDADDALIGQEINGIKIVDSKKISSLTKRLNAHIGVITVPEKNAQIVADQLISGGVLAIYNFSPIKLKVPDNIIVEDENIASSLAILSRHLSKKMKNQ